MGVGIRDLSVSSLPDVDPVGQEPLDPVRLPGLGTGEAPLIQVAGYRGVTGSLRGHRERLSDRLTVSRMRRQPLVPIAHIPRWAVAADVDTPSYRARLCREPGLANPLTLPFGSGEEDRA